MQSYFLRNPQEKPFYHSDLENTLEGIVFEQPSDGATGALERIFSDKTKTLKAGVKALLDEIALREKLNAHLLEEIEGQIDQQSTHLLRLKRAEADYSLDVLIELKKLTIKIEDKLLDLEQEKRKEELECWRDLMFLKKYLMSSLKEYWDLVKRGEVLSGST